MAVLHSPVDHVHGFEPIERTQPHATLTHHQVSTLDEVEPHVQCEVRLLHVRRMARTARQHHRSWVAVHRRGLRGQRRAQGVECTHDRRHPVGAGHLGHHPCGDRTVHHRVAEARRRIGDLLHHPPRTRSGADHVDGEVHRPRADRCRSGSAHRRERVEQRRRHHPFAEQPLLAIHVGEQHVHETRPLLHCLGDHLELSVVEHDRDGIEAPWPALGGGHPSHAVVEHQIVDQVAGALCIEDPVGLPAPLEQLAEVVGAQHPGQPRPRRPHGSIGRDRLVVAPDRGPVVVGDDDPLHECNPPSEC